MDSEISDYAGKRHQECILPPMELVNKTTSTTEQVAVLGQLSSGISRQNEHLEKVNMLAELDYNRKKEKDDQKKTD